MSLIIVIISGTRYKQVGYNTINSCKRIYRLQN